MPKAGKGGGWGLGIVPWSPALGLPPSLGPIPGHRPFLGDMALLSLALRHLLPYVVGLHSGFWGRVLSPSLLGFLGKAQFCHVLRGEDAG